MERILDISALEKLDEIQGGYEAQLIIKEFSDSQRPEEEAGRYPVRLKASLLILVLSGELHIHINYQEYTLRKNTAMQFTKDDILLNISHSLDFAGYLLLISSEFRMEIQRVTSGVRMQKAHQLKRAYPILELDEEEFHRAVEHIRRMQSYISDDAHLHRTLILRNEVMNLYLNLDNNRCKKYGDGEIHLTRSELLRERFREMLVEQCCRHRDVAYYARELCVTPDYLSRVVREYDGSSAMKWIANAVVMEARYLMRQSGKTINEIALELNFPDQSTFGKFFKRYTGVSPVNYMTSLNSAI